MSGHEDLQWLQRLLRAKRVEQPHQSMWLEPVLDLVDERDGRSRSCGALQPRNEKATRPSSQGTQGNASFVMKRDCTIAYRDRVSVEQRVRAGPDRYTQVGSRGGDHLQGLGELCVGLRSECGSCSARGTGELRAEVRLFLSEAIQHGTSSPREVGVRVGADAGWRQEAPVFPRQRPFHLLTRAAVGVKRPRGLEVASNHQPKRQDGFQSDAWLVLNLAGAEVEPAQEIAVGVDVLQRLRQRAERCRDDDVRSDVQIEEVVVAERRRPPSA